MPIWSLIGFGLLGGSKVAGWDTVLNTSYKAVIGNDITYVIGGGQIANIYGYKIDIILDWEYFISQFLPGKLNVAAEHIVKGFFGDAGLTQFTYGDRSDFTYYGANIEVDRTPVHGITYKPTKFYTEAQRADYDLLTNTASVTTSQEFNDARARVNADMEKILKTTIDAGYDPVSMVILPGWIRMCMRIGVLGLFAVAIILKFYNGIDSVYDSSNADEHAQLVLGIASSSITTFECAWLYILTLLEQSSQADLVLLDTAVINAGVLLATEEARCTDLNTELTNLPFGYPNSANNNAKLAKMKEIEASKLIILKLQGANNTAKDSVLSFKYTKIPKK